MTEENPKESTATAEIATPLWQDDKQPSLGIILLIGLNLCVFIAMVSSTLLNNAVADVAPSWISTLIAMPTNTLNMWGANTTSRTILDHEYWRLIASSFIHLNALHLAVNMYVLWDFTRPVERFFGTSKYLTIYLVSAIGS